GAGPPAGRGGSRGGGGPSGGGGGAGAAGEGPPAGVGRAPPPPPAAVADRAIDGQVAGLLERRELLRERRVGEAEAVAHEGEVGPVRRREQSDDGQARARVDQLVELGRRAHRGRDARLRSPAINVGPPSTSATATG